MKNVVPEGEYNPASIEAKWQEHWNKKPDQAKDFAHDPKRYLLIEFPYPSGDGLHVGHVRSYAALDVLARYSRLKGFNVLYPIGWDAFGLPTENYAIKTGVHPRVATDKNIATFRRQLKALGLSFDWSREVDTTDPKYYRWTQWIFLQFYKAGLAYQAEIPINWCPKDKIGLANEEVVDGKCERCGTEVTRKMQKQWMLKITAYADRLLRDLDTVEYVEKIKTQQKNWIGKSEGAEISFQIASKESQKPRFVLLHGFQGSAKGNFFPWLKDELVAKGYEVEVPELPNSAHPTEEEQVSYVLEHCRFDENTIVFGHSLGTVVAMKVIEKLPTKVAGLVMAGGFTQADFSDHDRPFRDTFTWNFDFQAIRDKAGFIKVLHDVHDDAVPEGAGEALAKALEVPCYKVTANEEHFCAKQEPYLLAHLMPNTLLVGTQNQAKVEMLRRALAPYPNIHLISLSDIGKVDDQALVEGDDFRANAKMKADFYHRATGLPTISTDHILWIEKWPEDNGFITHIRKLANPKSGRATDEELAEWIKKFIDKNGESRTAFHYAIGYADEKGVQGFVSIQREYMLKANPAKARWEGYAVGAFLRDPVTDAYREEMPAEIAFDRFFATVRNEIVPQVFDMSTLTVFTTRPDTIFGVTYMVVAPEHELLAKYQSHITNWDEVQKYVREAAKKSDMERTELAKEKSGVELKGIQAVNPANGEVIPIWVADYVLSSYGTGAIMAVPAHDQRDNEFAKKYSLQIREVVRGFNRVGEKKDIVYSGEGVLVNSQDFDGEKSEDAKKNIVRWLEEKGLGHSAVNFKLRDWVFSRQHYWGEPIPIIHCPKCGAVPVPEKDLPVELPHVEKYQPTNTGASPLAAIEDWVQVKCPKCKGEASRETDTMPNWAGSSWYFLRYSDPHNSKAFADKKKLEYWLPVDIYNGGNEHTTLHLLYSRFWHKFLFDQGLVPTPEPYQHRHSHGIVLAEDNRKMSKSWGNVVNPDDYVQEYGADSVRMYELFMGPFEDMIPWSTKGIVGVHRFLNRVWELYRKVTEETAQVTEERDIHKAVKKVGEDLEAFRFNTAVSTLMEYFNHFRDEVQQGRLDKEAAEKFLVILFPFAPHLASELWEQLGKKSDIREQSWPNFDPNALQAETVTIGVQINGKVRASISLSPEASEAEALELALAEENIQRYLQKGQPKKVIYRAGKILNLIA